MEKAKFGFCISDYGAIQVLLSRFSTNAVENSCIMQAVARIVSLGGASVLGADIFQVLYCYYLLAMLTVSVTEYNNIVVIK